MDSFVVELVELKQQFALCCHHLGNVSFLFSRRPQQKKTINNHAGKKIIIYLKLLLILVSTAFFWILLASSVSWATVLTFCHSFALK